MKQVIQGDLSPARIHLLAREGLEVDMVEELVRKLDFFFFFSAKWRIATAVMGLEMLAIRKRVSFWTGCPLVFDASSGFSAHPKPAE